MSQNWPKARFTLNHIISVLTHRTNNLPSVHKNYTIQESTRIVYYYQWVCALGDLGQDEVEESVREVGYAQCLEAPMMAIDGLAEKPGSGIKHFAKSKLPLGYPQDFLKG